MAEFTITSRRVLRYFVRSGGRRHAFSTIKAACRWLAIIELRKQVEPTVWRIFQDETRVWTTNESKGSNLYFRTEKSIFPPCLHCSHSLL